MQWDSPVFSSSFSRLTLGSYIADVTGVRMEGFFCVCERNPCANIHRAQGKHGRKELVWKKEEENSFFFSFFHATQKKNGEDERRQQRI